MFIGEVFPWASLFFSLPIKIDSRYPLFTKPLSFLSVFMSLFLPYFDSEGFCVLPLACTFFYPFFSLVSYLWLFLGISIYFTFISFFVLTLFSISFIFSPDSNIITMGCFKMSIDYETGELETFKHKDDENPSLHLKLKLMVVDN